MRASTRSIWISILAAGVLAGCAHAAKPAAEAKTKVAPPPRLGSIDREATRAVIQEHAPDMRSCFEDRLKVNRTLEGKVALKWVIEADGSVSRSWSIVVDEATTLRDLELHACMAARLVTWKFPAPANGVAIITYPWIFRTQTSAEAGQAER